MKLFAISGLLAISALFGGAEADPHKIVAAARSQIGVPYSWGGGSYGGKTKGIGEGAHTVGFDCSGLAQYAVFHGTGKKIARVADQQYLDHNCHRLPYAQHQAGDLVFYESGGHIHHVAIVSGKGTLVHAPHTGDHVREAPIWTQGLTQQVTRCW